MPCTEVDAYLPVSKRKVGLRPDSGSAQTIEPIKDAYFPTAVPCKGMGDRFPHLASTPDMVDDGYSDIVNDDYELTGGNGGH